MERPTTIHDHALEALSDTEAARLEDTLWWTQGRKAIIRSFLERVPGRPLAIVDVGCGSGGNLGVLAEFGTVRGVEPSETLARRAESRGIAAGIHRDVAEALAAAPDVRLFTMFDVLEHVEADVEFLADVRRRTAREHYVLASVPACPSLYGDHDRILHHHRRYSRRALRAALEGAGYRVLETSHFLFFLFPLAVASRLADRVRARLGRPRTTIELGELPRPLSRVFSAALDLEARLARRLRFPIGLWLFALAESSSAPREGIPTPGSASRKSPTGERPD